MNSAIVFAYWEIWKQIVEEEQGGQSRAEWQVLITRTGKSFNQRFREGHIAEDRLKPEASYRK